MFKLCKNLSKFLIWIVSHIWAKNLLINIQNKLRKCVSDQLQYIFVFLISQKKILRSNIIFRRFRTSKRFYRWRGFFPWNKFLLLWRQSVDTRTNLILDYSRNNCSTISNCKGYDNCKYAFNVSQWHSYH